MNKGLQSVFGNKIRFFIVDVLLQNKDVTISELHSDINAIIKSSYDYTAIHKHIKILEKNNIVVLTKRKEEQGGPVYVTIKDKDFSKKYFKILYLLRDEILSNDKR